MGFIMSLFFLSYSLGQIPTGWFADRVGSRFALPFFSLLWSAATAMFALFSSAIAFMISRLLNGIGQAGLFPGSTNTISKWFPNTERAMASGSLSSFMSVGGAIATLLTGVMLKYVGWRMTFFLYALPGVMWAVLFYLFFRNRPFEHPRVTPLELKTITDGQSLEQQAVTPQRNTPWIALLTSPAMWWINCPTVLSSGRIYVLRQLVSDVSPRNSKRLGNEVRRFDDSSSVGRRRRIAYRRDALRLCDATNRLASLRSAVLRCSLFVRLRWADRLCLPSQQCRIRRRDHHTCHVLVRTRRALLVRDYNGHGRDARRNRFRHDEHVGQHRSNLVPGHRTVFHRMDGELALGPVAVRRLVLGRIFQLAYARHKGHCLRSVVDSAITCRGTTMTHLSTPQSVCRFGIAIGDITPPVGIYHRMWGAASHDVATGVHRPLRATVAVLASPNSGEVDPSTHQILVALDHCIMGVVEMSRLLDSLATATSLPREVFVVVFSHTHAAGLMSLDRVDLPGGNLIPPYLGAVGKTVAKLTRDALSTTREAAIVYGQGQCDLAAQRDFWDEDSGQYVCGFNPEGETDDTVIVARVVSEGKTVASIVNYACHPTTLAWDNTSISPDYPGAMRELVEAATSAPCLFLQGASGDLGPREGYVGDVDVADRNGRQLGYAALAALEGLPKPKTHFRYRGPVVSGATLGAWEHATVSEHEVTALRQWNIRRWNLPLDYRPDLESIEQVKIEMVDLQTKEAVARSKGDEATTADFRALAERKRRLFVRLLHLPAEQFPLEIVLIKMGEAFWVIVQGEHYQQLQWKLRERFPETPVVVSTIASDWRAAYLPPREVYGKGIYQETVAVVAPGSLERVIESIGSAIHELQNAP